MATRPLSREPRGDQKKTKIVERRKAEDWTKPQAMAIPKGGYFADKVEQGRYGPIFPQTPACYGFSVVAKVIPGREEHLYNHAKVIEKAIADDPTTSPYSKRII
jgi:hypothetical protein